MNNKEMFNFKETEAPSNSAYLQPGMFTLTIKDAKYVKPTGTKSDGSPKYSYVEVTFGGQAGQVTHKYFITPKAIDRLQDIYTNWFDQKCEKIFESSEAVGAFFEKAFTSEKAKKTFKRMIISGKQVGDKVYADIPYSRYIIAEDADWFKEGPFVKDSADWIYHVKVDAPNISSNTNDVMIPVGEVSSNKKEDFSDDLPF